VPYDSLIGQAEANALIPAEAAQEIITATAQASAALTLCRTVRMSSKTYAQPVLTTAPLAYWVTNGLKQTSAAAWKGIELTAEEIAVIVPVEDDILNDSEYPIWTELRVPIGQEFARKLDAAVFAGTDAPDSWPDAIIPACTAADAATEADSAAADGGIVADLGELLDLVEGGGFDPTGYAASRKLKGLLRKSRSTTGESLGEATVDSVWSLPIRYAVGGTIPAPNLAIAGDWSMAVLGVRKEVTYETFREGVITDDEGNIVANLMQEDKSALRVTARYGFATAVPATIQEPDAGEPFPFALLTAPE
jgi:HK97 family phage major capsid protein